MNWSNENVISMHRVPLPADGNTCGQLKLKLQAMVWALSKRYFIFSHSSSHCFSVNTAGQRDHGFLSSYPHQLFIFFLILSFFLLFTQIITVFSLFSLLYCYLTCLTTVKETPHGK